MTSTRKKSVRRQRRRVPPLPIQSLIEHPSFIAMPSAAVGMMFRLVTFYWATECQPLPTQPSQIYAICRADPAIWAKYREKILAVFLDIKDELEDQWVGRLNRRGGLIEAAARARAIKAQRKLLKNAPREADRTEAITVRERDRVERPPTPDQRGERKRVSGA